MGTFFTPIQPIQLMDFSKGSENNTKEVNSSGSFQNFLENAIEEVNQTTQAASDDGYSLAIGDTDDLAQLQINGLKATAMIQTAVQITSRAVNAYKEIMQMQI